MPASAARACAVAWLSPVSIATVYPWTRRCATTSAASGRNSSRTATAPTGNPSTSTRTAVAPARCMRATSAASGPAWIQPGRPSRSVRPSRMPVSPAPTSAVTSSAARTASVATRIALASGCSLRTSRAAAHASTCAREKGSIVATSITAGWLRVRVPVLSSAIVRTRPRVSRAAPPLIRMPRRLAAPIEATVVTGTEIANAHGEAATTITSARCSHSIGSPSRNPATTVSVAAIRMPGTSGLAIRSASRWVSPLRDCSASTMCTIRANELSSARAVTSISRTPEPLIDPAKTCSPGPTSIGIDSPVIAEVSSAVRPVLTTPSVASRSPGRTTIRSPTTRPSGAITTSRPLRRTVASRGTRSSSARNP